MGFKIKKTKIVRYNGKKDNEKKDNEENIRFKPSLEELLKIKGELKKI